MGSKKGGGMRKEEITISGTVEFEGEEYDYTAVLRDRRNNSRPSEVTDIDCADGSPVPDSVDFEALEELAMKNAELLDWCSREGWQEEDTGGGCSALIRAPQGLIQRITKEGDPTMPQTMSEPIAVGLYNWNDELLGEIRIFKGGIDEWIQSGGYKNRKPLKEPELVLKEGVIYSGDNGERICRKCAGQSALYTGRDRSGMKVRAIPRSENKAWRAFFGKDMACERGCTRYGKN
jgi:hypothetical protein